MSAEGHALDERIEIVAAVIEMRQRRGEPTEGMGLELAALLRQRDELEARDAARGSG